MRIGFDAQVLTEAKTAAAHYLSKLVEHLVQVNPRVEIVLFCPDKICLEYEPFVHRPQVSIVIDQHSKRDRHRWPAKALPSLLKNHKIDVFHAAVRESLPVFRPPCASVLTVFDLMPWKMHGLSRSWLDDTRWHARHWMWSRIADQIITVSETIKKDVVVKCRIPPEKVVVTPMGASSAETSLSLDEEQKIIQKFRLTDKKYVVSVSGLDRSRRNPDFLLEAFSQCHRSIPDDLFFVFTGENFKGRGLHELLMRKLEALGIRENVIITGFVSDRVFQVILRNAIASVVTPFYTGTSLAVLDSFSSGVPVVASDCAAIREVAGQAALLIDPFDPSAIAQAVCRLADSEDERMAFAALGAEQARKFSWAKMAEETFRVYERVLSAPQALMPAAAA